MNLQHQKYQQKSKYIFSAEPNYLCQFEMRYPVLHFKNLEESKMSDPNRVENELKMIFKKDSERI